MSVDVCYVISHGFAARTVLHTGIVPELRRRGHSVTVAAPNADEPSFQELCASLGAGLVAAPAVGGRLLSAYAPARRYLFEDFRTNAALCSKHLRELHAPTRRWRKLRPLVGGPVNAAMLRLPRVRRALGKLERSAIRSRAVRDMLQELQPKLLVATYPVNWPETMAIREAQRLGIRTVGQLLSWDNISCKGRFAAIPERFISWGPIMTRELWDYYGVGPERVVECGVAHFDAHVSLPTPAERTSILETVGLNGDAPILFFGMSAAHFCPEEIAIVEHLSRLVERGGLGEGVQLLVRPHPQNVTGDMVDPEVLRRIRALVGPKTRVDIPEVKQSRMPWQIEPGDLARLSVLLHESDVVLNSGSTLTIDALMHDRPVVLPMFDGDRQLESWRSVRRILDFPHIAKLLRFGGVKVVSSFAELEQSLGDYLRDPGADATLRERARSAEVGPRDGRAALRIAEAISGLVEQAR